MKHDVTKSVIKCDQLLQTNLISKLLQTNSIEDAIFRWNLIIVNDKLIKHARSLQYNKRLLLTRNFYQGQDGHQEAQSYKRNLVFNRQYIEYIDCAVALFRSFNSVI